MAEKKPKPSDKEVRAAMRKIAINDKKAAAKEANIVSKDELHHGGA